MGETVRPMRRHWMKWAIISRLSAMSAPARQRLASRERIAFGHRGAAEHGRRIVRRVFGSWVPQSLFMDAVWPRPSDGRHPSRCDGPCTELWNRSD